MRMMQKGFSLIELMVVIAIIGTLATIVFPVYQDYLGRAQMAEEFNLVSKQKASF